MKRHFILTLLSLITIIGFAQVTTTPAIIQKDYMGEVVITFDPSQGNKQMIASTDCYAHIGLITNLSTSDSDWRYATEWLKTDKKMTKVGNTWQLVITPDIYTYYGCDRKEDIRKLAFVFNDGKNNGKEGKAENDKDIFVEIAEQGLAASIDVVLPAIAKTGSSYTFTCHSTLSADLSFSVNGKVVETASNATTLTYTHTLSQTGNYTYTLTATANGNTATASAFTCIPTAPVSKARPTGIDMGIYYDNDPTKVTLSTFAAHKSNPNSTDNLIAENNVFVIGDFNDWTISNDYQLYKDGNYFWITLTGLTPKQEYAFQYVVLRTDGKIKYLSDLYSELILDSGDGTTNEWTPSCPKMVYPNLKAYPSKADGSYVSVLQTGKDAYPWSDATLHFQRPDKNNLVIYETWVYDFTPRRSFAGLMDRLDYLQNLGINCLELMPVCEFDGNNSWGYSPNHYFAVDKVYGSSTQLKDLIDACHQRGIAVVIDMVFNHATGNNPMNKLYPSGTDLKLNPWFNVIAPHKDNVYEDWNHDFEPANRMFHRAIEYWLTEYKVDGFRFDLSFGYSGPVYNATDHLMDYYKTAQKTSANSYFMLEHWDTWDEPQGKEYPARYNSDRGKLVDAGMTCWQSTNNAFMQTAMGWLKDGDALYAANMQGYVSYSDNHDEERTFFKAKQFGAGTMTTDLNTRAARVPLTVGFQCMLAGSQLFYHFTELGFDYSKFQNSKGQWGGNLYGIPNETGDSNDGVKMQVKARPERLGWFQQGPRMNGYQRLAQILQLRTRLLPDVFKNNPTESLLGSGQALRYVRYGNDVYVAANFSATETYVANLPAGTWYDYLDGGNKANSSYTLQPGQIKVFTGSQIAAPDVPDHYDIQDGINNVLTPQIKTRKLLRDGQILIEREDGTTYNIMGTRLK